MADESKNLEGDKVEQQIEPKTFSESVVKELRKENASWRTKLRDTEKQMEELSAKIATVDTDKYFALLDEEKNKERKKLEDEGQWEKIKSEMQKTHTDEIQALLDKENQAIAIQKNLESELNQTILSNQITGEASKAECLNPSVLQLILAQEARVTMTESGTRVTKVTDLNGEQRMNPKTGNPFTIADRITEMKEDPQYAMLFRGGKYGAGSHTTTSSRTNGNPFKAGSSYNLTEQGKLIKEQPDLAKRLANEAGQKLDI